MKRYKIHLVNRSIVFLIGFQLLLYTLSAQTVQKWTPKGNTQNTTSSIGNNATIDNNTSSDTISQNNQIPVADISFEDFMSKLNPRNEIVKLRDQYSRHYINPDGTKTAIIASGGSLNYFKDNEWKAIDTKISENKSNNSKKRYQNIENRFQTYYPEKSTNGITVNFSEGEIVTWNNKSIAFIDSNGTISKQIKSNEVKGFLVNDAVYYREVFENVDSRFIQGYDGNKMDYVIKSSNFTNVIPEHTEFVVFYEEYLIPDNWTAIPVIDKNFKGQEIIKEILFVANKNNPIIRLNMPYYFEQNNNLKKDKGFMEGSYDFSIENNIVKVGLKIPVSWLKSEKRTYPIVIDPTNDYYPNNTSWWTGTTERDDDSPNTCYEINDYIQIGWLDYTWPTSNGRRNGWAKYNITSIPDAAQIVNTNIMLYCYETFGGLTVYFSRYSNNSTDPVSRTATQRYSDVLSGVTYTSRYCSSTGSYNINAGTTMNSDIQARLAANWYVLGMYGANNGEGGSWDDDSYYVKFSGYSASGTSRPYLRIKYCDYAPVANAGLDKTICNTNTTTMTASALSAGETGQWTIVSGCSGCTFSNSTSPTTDVNNIPAGTSVLKWKVTITDGGCSATDNVNIFNNTPTTANAGVAATTCTGSIQLGGNNPSVGIGTWSVISGSGTFTPNNNTYNATVSNLNNGNNTFRWTISNNGCSTSSDVVITQNAVPTATINTPASSPYDLCADNFTGLTANNPAPASGQWSVVSGSGTFSAGTSNTTNISGLSLGDNIIRWTVTATGLGCVNQDNVTLRNNLPSVANAGPAQMISGSTATLTGNNPVQGIGQWSLISAVPADADGIIWSPLGPPAGQNSVTVSDLEPDIMYTFRWTIANSTCPNSTSNTTVYWDPGVIGLIVQSNLTNEGHFNQTNDTSYFFMTGLSNFIYGTDASNRYTNAKLKVRGSITFDGVINNGKFIKTWISSACGFSINNSRTYKNDYFYNSGTTTLSATSSWENSGTWFNAHIIDADPTSTVKFNGTSNQLVTSNWDGVNNAFGNVSIDNSSIPNGSTGVTVSGQDMVLKNTSSLILEDGVLIPNGKMIIVNNPAANGIILGTSNTTGTESWVYGISDASCLRKYINDGENVFHFPVGGATHGNLATITSHGLPNGAFYLDSWFKENPSNVNLNFPDSIIDHNTIYTGVAPEGVWVFNKNGIIDGTYDLKLYYNQFDTTGWSDGFFSILSRESDLGDGSNWTLPPTNSLYESVTVPTGYASRLANNSFSEKGVGLLKYEPPSNLPVELITFISSCLDDKPTLIWETVTEINNSHFIIEKSTNAIYFIPIARIQGSGNSNTLKKYTYTDLNYSQNSYYRIKQVDYNGQTRIYDPIVVKCDKDESFLKVYPNPFKNQIIISASFSSPLNIQIIDGIGKIVYAESLPFEQIKTLDLSNLSRGVYTLTLIFADQEPKQFKIVKN